MSEIHLGNGDFLLGIGPAPRADFLIRILIAQLLQKIYQYFITSLLLTSLWKAARSRIRISRKTRRSVLIRFLGGDASFIVSYSILVSREPNPTIYEKVFRNLHLLYDRQNMQHGSQICNTDLIRALLSPGCTAVFKEPKERTSCR